jgi:hypothetical protein
MLRPGILKKIIKGFSARNKGTHIKIINQDLVGG